MQLGSDSAKHGASLTLASQPGWKGTLVLVDSSHIYGEVRHNTCNLIVGLVYFVPFVGRTGVWRLAACRGQMLEK